MTNKSDNPREKLYRKVLHGRWVKIVSAMASVVVFVTVYALILPAITLSNQAPKCNAEEHKHVAECYDAEGNVVCGTEEHVHNLACYSDLNAAIENEEYWAAELPELTGDRNADVIAVAKSQIGYRENEDNYIVSENDQMKGYTRYGHWYGDTVDTTTEKLTNGLSDYAYRDWDAMFVSFVLRYAEIYDIGFDSDAGNWAGALSDAAIYVNAADCVPQMGDLIFFTPHAGEKMRVGIVSSVNRGFFGSEIKSISVILGDSNNAVEEVKVAVSEYTEGDITFETIHGYGVLTPGYGEQEVVAEQEEAVTPEVEVENTDEAVIAEEGNSEETAATEQDVEEVTEISEGESVSVGIDEISKHIIGQAEENLENAEQASEGEVSVALVDTEISEANSEIIMNWNMTTCLPEAVLPTGSIIRVDTSTGKTHVMTVEQVYDWAQKAEVGIDNATYVDNVNFEVTFIGDNGHLYSWDDVQNMNPAAVTSFTGIHIKALNDVALAEDKGVVFDFASTAKVADANAGQNYYVSKASVNGASGAENYVYTNGKAETVDQNAVLRDAGLETEPTEKTLTSKKDDYTVTMTYGPEAGIPDGAKLYVKEIKQGTEEYNHYIEDAKAAFGISEEDAAELLGRFFDIKIITKEGEFEPKAPVSVNIEYKRAIETEDTSYVNAVHFTENGAEAIPVEAADVSELEDEMAKVKSVEFCAESFSVYGIIYTVDFDYNGYTWSMYGGDSILLSELAEKIGLCGEGAGVAFVSSVTDVRVELTAQNDEIVEENEFYVEAQEDGDWLLRSDVAFGNEYSLIITLLDGSTKSVKVTDAAIVPRQVAGVNISGSGATDGGNTWTLTDPQGQYDISLHFAEIAGSGGAPFPPIPVGASQYQLTYQLPTGITVDAQSGSTEFYNADLGISAPFTWSIDGNGLVTITFSNDPSDAISVEGTPRTPYWIFNRTQNAKLDVTFSGKWDQTTNQINFGNGIIKDIVVDTPPEPELNLLKDAVYEESTHRIKYTITGRSTGDISEATIEDAFINGANGITIDPSTISIRDNNGQRNDKYVLESPGNNGFKYKIYDLYEGLEFYITYYANIDYKTLDTDKNGKVSINVDNEVTGGKDDITKNFTKEISYSSLEKSGVARSEVITEGNKQYRIVDWTATVNKDGLADMSGTTFTDRITSTTPPMVFTGDPITVIAVKNGQTTTTTVPYNSLTQHTNSQWQYTFPANAGYTEYTFKYTTKVDVTDLTAEAYPSNEIETKYGKTSQNTKVKPGNQVIINKEALTYNDEEIVWKITLTIPPQGVSSAEAIDTMPNYEGKVDIVNSVEVEGLVNDEDYVYRPENNGFRIYFYQNKNHTKNGLEGTGTSRTVTVIVNSTPNSEWVNNPSASKEHTNRFDFAGEYDTETVKITKRIITKSAPQKGNDVTYKGIKYTPLLYTVELNGVDGPVTLTDEVNIEGAFFLTNYYLGDTDPGWTDYSSNSEVNAYYNYNWNNIWTQENYNRGVYHATITSSGNTATIYIPDNMLQKNGDEYYDRYQVKYYVMVPYEKALELALDNGNEFKLVNTVDWGGKKDHSEYKFKYDGIKKELLNLNDISATNRWAEYRITINPDGREVNGGAPYDLNDTFSNTLAIDYNSITFSDDDAVLNYSITSNTVYYLIKDSRPLTITYRARLLGEGSDIPFNNTATTTWGEAKTTNKKTITGSGGGEGSSPNVTILKVDEDNAKIKLRNVKFILDTDDATAKQHLPSDQEKRTYKTDTDGKVTVKAKSNWDDDEYIDFNTTYKLIEVPESVPENYTPLTEPYTFRIDQDGNIDWTQHQYYNGYNMQIKNKIKKGNLNVTKSVSSKDDTDKTKPFNVTVTFYNDSEMTLVNTDLSGPYGDVTIAAGVANFTITDGSEVKLTGIPAGLYYKVQEVLEGEDAETFVVTYDGEVKDNVTGQIDENGTDAVALENTKVVKGINVMKTWDPEPDDISTKTLRVYLYRRLKSASSDAKAELVTDVLSTSGGSYAELSEATEWKGYWENIIFDDNYDYYIREDLTGAASYTATYTQGGTEMDGSVQGSDNKPVYKIDTSKEVIIIGIDNKKTQGSLKLTKEVTVNSQTTQGKLADGKYNFTITGPDESTETVATVEITVTNGKAESAVISPEEAGEFGEDKFVEIKNLTEGVYKITETPPENSATISKINGTTTNVNYTTVTVTAGKSGPDVSSAGKATFTNNINTGELDISKTVVSNLAADANQQFEFTVQLKRGALAYANKEVTVTTTDGASTKTTNTDGKITVNLKGGETAQITDIPQGISYEVVETAVTGFTNTEKTGESGEISAQPSTAAFTNKRNEGELDVTKTVQSVFSPDTSKDFEFKISFKEGVNPYTNKEVSVQINTAATGGNEAVPGNPVSMTTNELGEITINLKHNQTAVITKIPTTVNYTVSEKEYNEFSTTPDTAQIGTIGDTASTVGFTNVRKLGNLSVTKSIKDAADATAINVVKSYPVEITVTIDGTKYWVQNNTGALGTEAPDPALNVSNALDGTLVIANLPYGQYEVSEVQPGSVQIDDYSYVTVNNSVSVANPVINEASQNPTADLVNYYVKGVSWSPEVHKLLDNESYSGNEFSYTIHEITGDITGHTKIPDETISTTTDGKVVFSAIKYSNNDFTGDSADFIYEIKENTVSDQYISIDSDPIYAKVTVTKVNGKLVVAGEYYSDSACNNRIDGNPTFENTSLGNLEVQKIVTGSYTATNNDEYPITITNSEGKFLNKTPTGGWTLEETDPGLKVKAGESNKLTFNKLPVGKYTVVEGDVTKTGYTITTTYQVNSDATTSTNAEAQVVKEATQSVTITNKYRDAELKVTKTIAGIDADDIETELSHISFKIEDVTQNVTDKTPTIEGVTITSQDLVQGKYVKTFNTVENGILPDHTYKITETVTSSEGYTLTSTTYTVSAGTAEGDAGSTETPASGTLSLTGDDTSIGQMDISNVYKKETKEAEVTKIWKDDEGNDSVWDSEIENITLYMTRKKGSDTDTGFGTDGTVTLVVTSDGVTISPELTGVTAEVVLKTEGIPTDGYVVKVKGLEKNYRVGEQYQDYTYFFSEAAIDDYKTAYATSGGQVITEAEEVVSEGQIINTPISAVTLPETGGNGTTAFYMTGMILLAFAGIFYIIKSRRFI